MLPTSRLAARSAPWSIAPEAETPCPRLAVAARVLEQGLQAGAGGSPARRRRGIDRAVGCVRPAWRADAGDAYAGRPAMSTKRTRNPGCNNAGTSRARSHIGVAVTPMICQPPGLACG